ncbi:hypothetical protein M378DRAFT_158322 [Amanita muscaria Koide BX008]|uniref:Uncharacterized protein n=1 Tax=Amanita muscaria (strain Koide BX008) TaxID=946122 RepID=A0A0C2X319_AMAMK|nr:hypothetical protein M378DRAFT_158322 [Amanita muscaria Koide BX008]
MPASKRKAEDSKSPTRASKAAKTAEHKDKPKNKPAMSAKAFKDRAKALHVTLTETEGSSIGELDLVPTSFNTGSYGWKGSKKVIVQLPAPEGEETGNVQVMLTINATVVGSKAAGGEESNEKEEKEE